MPLPLKNYSFAIIIVEFWKGTGILVHISLLFIDSVIPELFSCASRGQVPFLGHRTLHLLLSLPGNPSPTLPDELSKIVSELS